MLREALYATLIRCFSDILRVALPLPTPGGGSGGGMAALVQMLSPTL
jgi:NCAIR mutase (PurE)-related protein